MFSGFIKNAVKAIKKAVAVVKEVAAKVVAAAKTSSQNSISGTTAVAGNSGILKNFLPNIEETKTNYLGSGKTLPKSNMDVVFNILRPVQDYEMLRSPTNDVRQISQINRFKMQIPTGKLATKSFIFMTRPNLHLFNTTTNSLNDYKINPKELNPDLSRLPVFNYIWNLGQNEYKLDSSPCLGMRIYMSLCNFVSGSYNSLFPSNDPLRITAPWLSIITNQANGYSPIDRELDTVSVSETFHGNKVMYAEPTFKHKIGGTMSIDFTDRRDLSLFYTLKLWIEYIQAITTGLASPYRKYICQGILDYAVSLYYVVTDETMENILYWEKLTGVFPLSVPDGTLFGTSEGNNEKDLKYSVNFAYSMRSVQHEAHLMEINALYGITADNIRFGIDGSKMGTNEKGSATYDLASYLSSTAAARVGFKSRGAEDWNALYQNIQSFYGKSLKDVKKNDFTRWYSLTPKGISGEFYPNWVKEENIHGIPYVNGPYVAYGGSTSAETKAKVNKSAASANLGQPKLRWI